MLNTYVLNDKTPLITVVYEPSTAQDQLMGSKTMQFMQTQVMPMGAGNGGQIRCTLPEQALIRRLLYLNSAKLAPAFDKSLTPDQRTFKRSFILPIGPLDQAQIGKIINNVGCGVCGSTQTKA